ncbi:FkbM family methyltransferase [Streptomyces sp. B1866]|uniref:FkbM family methyltransferase n=1 Tax=Streptomyces sp. B1866 TaxID=3075431 RepID=UPI002891E77C|nr:FkbM family methyltransferase [Streptomyces sp. B1866]MDT3400194.1 FkbM family methyltransferase [Streptomyces sp. B1866]
MPLAITLPLNPDALAAHGPYPRALNVLSRKQTAVQRQLRRAGLAGYEPLTQATLLALAGQAPPGGAVYDVGAHIGLYAALVSAVYGPGSGLRAGPRTYAFEPTPGTARLAREVAAHNGLDFEVVQAAVAAAPGTAELYLSHTTESSNSLNPAHRGRDRSLTVPVTTVDAFTAERSAAPHLIKIDVETSEAAVLAGALRTVRRHRPWIVCELLPGADHAALRAALAPLTALGYGLHLIAPEHPWRCHDETSYRALVGGQCRDWLLAPGPLTPGFHRSVRRWLIAILACDETTNLLTPGGTPFPPGWNAPYTRPAAPPGTPYEPPARAVVSGRVFGGRAPAGVPGGVPSGVLGGFLGGVLGGSARGAGRVRTPVASTRPRYGAVAYGTGVPPSRGGGGAWRNRWRGAAARVRRAVAP